uniref:Uncharacterized protein n=1 Tax=Arundo donax TaxID=35708 RepID=A0A0A9H5N0_ARUDO
MEPDEAGGDAGVVAEGVRHRLPDQRLRVGAARVVEPYLQLAAGHRRQLEAQQRDGDRHGRRHHGTIRLLAWNRRHADNVWIPG